MSQLAFWPRCSQLLWVRTPPGELQGWVPCSGTARWALYPGPTYHCQEHYPERPQRAWQEAFASGRAHLEDLGV